MIDIGDALREISARLLLGRGGFSGAGLLLALIERVEKLLEFGDIVVESSRPSPELRPLVCRRQQRIGWIGEMFIAGRGRLRDGILDWLPLRRDRISRWLLLRDEQLADRIE
ncbi:MAG: hypothetical protein J0H41_07065 [Rhizobiales bacterium]|nr:hypothetical protein [Hyphomicrobiales bacterium]